jgi:hypothetical protein
MPAAEELPNVDRLVRAYHGALVSERRYADTHVGSIHSHWARTGALLWVRQTERTAEEFRSLYFTTAKNERLDAYIAGHFPGKARKTDEAGEGAAQLSRSSTAAGAGVFWAKTRIAVGGASSDPLRYYYVENDTPCSSTDTNVRVAVTASAPGPQSRIDVRAGERAVLRVEDPLWDNTWTVQELRVGEGTLRESDDAARSRISAELFEERFGYEAAIIKAMKAVGAGTVALFRSDYLGEDVDHGLNRIYVGDISFETSATLLRDCRLAAPAVVMAGAANQVLPMATYWLDFAITLRFWDTPGRFDLDSAQANAKAAAVEYFETRENPFAWSLTGLRGAIRRAVEDTQTIEITPSQAPPALASIFDNYPLRRYRTTPQRVTVSLASPS